MKAWITSNGQLTIQPETTTEDYALNAWLKERVKIGAANSEEVFGRTAIIIEDLAHLDSIAQEARK